MTDRFGLVAVELAEHSARLLGWRPGEFWDATPAELATALGLNRKTLATGIDRAALNQLMEHDNDADRR
ncbi:MAG: phage tail assembly chaperone [Novosphingobium sp.]|nr:phage tail assembly chaperone [Novosphingobium sp.]